MRIPYEKMVSIFSDVLEKHGMSGKDAALSAKLFADASRDGVHSHGADRFPRFIRNIDDGFVDVSKRAVKESSIGLIERWNGQKGAGNINAWVCMQRAVALAKEHTIGVVALHNTNHWMRAGNYGIEAAAENCIALLWTNAMPNMPPWGSKDVLIGNNPIVLAVPHDDTPLVVDIACSMFSYGKLERYKAEGRECPVDGGIDEDGNVSRDPEAILRTRQLLPTGYWKGSGLAIALDLIAASLSGGLTTKEVGLLPIETEVSQVFIAISMDAFPDKDEIERKIDETLRAINQATPLHSGTHVHYPGEGMKREREKSEAEGVFVRDEIWDEIMDLYVKG